MQFRKTLLLLSFLFITAVSAQNTHYIGPIIDTHCHVSLIKENFKMADRDSKPNTINKIYMDEQFKKAGLIYMAKKQDSANVSIKNDSLIELCKSNTKYYPICSVHPDHGQAALNEIERIYKKGVRFLKFHGMTQGINYNSSNMWNVVEKASSLGMVMLFDGWNPDDATLVSKILNLATSHPKGKFIIAHMGGDDFGKVVMINIYSMQDWYKNNVYVDLSGISLIYQNSPYVEQIKWTVRKIGVDKVFFGSDYPLMAPRDAVKAIESFGFTEKEMEAIMYGNAKKLLSSVGIDK